MSLAILIVRLVFGLGISVHGAQKLFGWFEGHGLAGTGGFFEMLGFRPGRTFAFLAGAGELGSGLLVALGLLGPVGPALMIVVMTVAIVTVHWPNGFLVSKNGFELPLLYAAGAMLFAFEGFGDYSVDALLAPGIHWSASTSWLAIGIALAVAAGNIALRRPAAVPATSRA
jgi:putative oxidoreductase